MPRLQATTDPQPHLRRSLSLWDATALVVGCVIGAGIFRSTASIAIHIHTPALVMFLWVLGGVISFCGALCYAELGAAYPRTGGDYVYLRKAYGDRVSFLFGWTKVFTERIGTISILGFVFAEYAARIFGLGILPTRILATLAILILTWGNIQGVHVGKNVQNFFTVLKIGALVTIIGVGISMAPMATAFSDVPLSTSLTQMGTLQSLGVALVFVLWTYGGWTESAYVAQEIRDPHRVLPWSILVGLGIVTVLYLAVNWVYLLFIPLTQMPGKPLVASEVMQMALGPWGGTVTAAMVAASAFGALNGYILTSGRILLAMGQDHPLFNRWAQIHPQFATPAKALAFNGLAAVFLVWIGTFDQIVTYSTVAISIFFAMGAMSVIVLRIRDPQTPRPYRVWGYPITPIFFLVAMVLFVANMARMMPVDSIIGFGLVLLGFPLYAWSQRLRSVHD